MNRDLIVVEAFVFLGFSLILEAMLFGATGPGGVSKGKLVLAEWPA